MLTHISEDNITLGTTQTRGHIKHYQASGHHTYKLSHNNISVTDFVIFTIASSTTSFPEAGFNSHNLT